MATVKITNRPPEYDAIQYTGDNEAEIAAFVGFLFQPSSGANPPAVYDPIARMLRPLSEDGWVVLIGAQHQVLTSEEFNAAYIVSPAARG